MSPKINFSRIVIIVIILSLVLIYPLLWMRMLADPVQYTGADFIAFYAAGRIADNEGAEQAYDLSLQKKYQEEVVGRKIQPEETFPYIHPPFVIPLAQIAATPDYLDSFQRWAALMILLLIPGIFLLSAPVSDLFSRTDKLVFAVSLFLFFPVFQSILLGQDNAILLLGISILAWGIYKKADWAVGLGLAFATVRPHLALFILLPFVFQKHSVLKWFLLFASGLAAFSLAYAGISGLEGFLRILTVSGGGEGYRTNEENMINLIGLVRRILPSLTPVQIRTAGWLFYALAFLSLGFYFQRRSGNIAGREISLAAIVAVFFSPHSHAQDMILFIVPIVTLAAIPPRGKFLVPCRAALIPLGISLVLLFSYYSPLLKHSIPYALMAGLVWLIWRYRSDSSVPA
ncbi:hypothetical protein ANAEL_05233 [Anaerolineales bacterium]|nr:hypothetical protein ANAEL_05233 [Anaerolineales bacterium]